MKPVSTTGRWRVPWIEALPDGWQFLSAKRLFQARPELASVDAPQLAATQAYGVIEQAEYERRVGRKVTKLNKNLDKRRLVKRDDFIISMRSFEGGLERAWAEGGIRSSYIVLKPSAELRVGYYQHLFKSQPYIQALRATGNFIREGQDLNYSNFSLVDLPYPPLEDQELIARYLDWHGAMTGKLIRAKRRLIALLNEQKQSIIHRAVTRGLDPAAKLKPSGVDWLGDLPEHWDVLKLARLVTSTNAGEVIDKGWWGRGDETLFTCARQPLASDFDSFPDWKRTTGKDLLLTRNGTPYIHRPPANAIYSNVVQRINLTPDLNREFVALALEVAAFRMRGYGVSIESLNYNMWKALVVVRPPLSEQSAIVTEVREANADADTAIQQTLAEIALIQEFRTRLIADVVTGQHDVRAVAANLPDVAEADAADLTDDDDLDDDADDLIDEEEAA